jgi:hypothetical protein
MVLTIGPTVERARRRQRLVLHIAGLLAGAVTIALVAYLPAVLFAAVIGHVPAAVRWVGALIAGLWAVRVAVGRGLPFPSSSWQVPEVWLLTLPRDVTVTLYGYLLGMGLLTSVVAPVYWCFLAGSVSYPHFVVILVAWICYAATRAAMTTIGVFRYFEATKTASVPRSTPTSRRGAQVLAVAGLVCVAIGLVVGV